MRFLYSLAVMACVIASLLVTGQSSAAQSFDVYILTGQSNSLGTTRFDGERSADYGPGADESDQSVSFFWSNVHASNTGYPPKLYGDSDGKIVPLTMQQGDGAQNPAFWGPEFGFARTLAKQSTNNVLIIKASRGGGGNGLWDLAVFEQDHDAGHMWRHLCDTVDAGLEVLVDRGDRFVVKGLLYVQGESNSAEEAAVAGHRLKALHENLSGYLEKAYPGTASKMKLVVGEIASSQHSAARRVTAKSQSELAQSRDHFAYVETNDLKLQPDRIHFGRDAKLKIGIRMAKAYNGMTSIDEPPDK